MSQTKKTKTDISNEPPPAGAKQITRTTTERFQEPLHGDGAGACVSCGEPPLAVVHTKTTHAEYHEFTTRLNEVDEVDTAEEVAFIEDEPKASPLDSLLSSLKGVGEITVYIIRKPDPIGLNFREPCQISHTAGDLPFDETFTSKEAIELAVQSVYGGGKYQLQIRQNGDYVTAWTTLIADPRRREAQPPSTSQQAASAEPPRSARDELREVLELAKEIADVRGRNPQQNVAALPPADPVAQFRETFGVFKEMRGEIRDMVGDIAPAGGERNWVDSATNLVDKLTNSKLVVELGTMFGGAVLDYIRTANGIKAPAAESPGGPAPPQQSLPAGSTTEPPAAPVKTDEPPPPSAEDQAAFATAIEVVVRELLAYDESDDNDEDAEHVKVAAGALINLPPEMLNQLLAAPAALLLFQLSQMNPAWSTVANLPHAMTFVDALKNEINERLQPEDGKGSEVVNLAEVKQQRAEGKP